MDTENLIKEQIKNSHYYKFRGIAPEGFILVPIEVIEMLKDFENWKEFKGDEYWISKKSKEILK